MRLNIQATASSSIQTQNSLKIILSSRKIEDAIDLQAMVIPTAAVVIM
jgi:hypothetical protein